MGSPLGQAIDNIFMCSFESKWLQDCPNDFKPVFYRHYVDDIFALFSSPDHADKFKEYLSSKHPNINFTIENFKSFIPETCKIGLIKSLLFRCFSLCSELVQYLKIVNTVPKKDLIIALPYLGKLSHKEKYKEK